ncbi:MAG: TIM-barrel domain-containing protein, partial [Chloroflexota bacterium]
TVNDFRQQIIDNDKIIKQYDAKYLKPASSDVIWQSAQAVERIEQVDTTLNLYLAEKVARLRWINPQTLHVRFMNTDDDRYFSYFVRDDIDYANYQPYVTEDEDSVRVLVGDYHYVIDKSTLAIHCLHDDAVQWETTLFAWADDDSQTRLSMRIQADEACFGTGERAFGLNLRGRKLPIWNTDPGGYARGDDPINSCVPFYLGVHDKASYGVLWDDSSRAMFDLGASDSNQLIITGETEALSVYFFVGDTVQDVMTHYINVTGSMQMPPLWALGYHQSRYSYMSNEDVIDIAVELRSRNIPCDVIYLDIHYMDGYRVFTWDAENYGDMASMVKQLHVMNMRVVPILDPGVKVDEGYIGYDSGIKNDVFIKYPDGESVAGVVWPGLCYFPDFSSQKTRDWWAENLSTLVKTGIDGIWNDMNEPLIFGDDKPPQDLPDYAVHSKEGFGGTHQEVHNVYGTLMAQASLQALENHRPDKRQFTFTRACTAGTQRVASSWTGDNHSTWDDLHIAITTTLQMGLSGIAFTGSDIGGFMRDTTPELLTRWTQAGAFMPFFRNHSAVDVIYQEPWRFGQPYENIMREAIQLRYRLMPMMYTAFAQHATFGTPIVRPLFMAEPNNASIRDIDDTFMLGDTLLVAPILKPSEIRRTVYLPEGDWYDFHTNERYHGGQMVRVDAPLDYIPLFVKSGTVLPLWDNLQHLSNPQIDTLKLRIYTDSGETVIYEDAGEGLAYLEGDYRWVTYRAEEQTDSLTLTRTAEGDYIPTYKHIELQLIGSRSEIARIDVDGITHFDFGTDNDIYTITVGADFEEVLFKA